MYGNFPGIRKARDLEAVTKVLDFSSDSDDKRDSNGHPTSASLNVGPFPKSFTICSAFRVMRWNNYDQRAPIFALQGHRSGLFSWGHISVRPTGGYTEFTTRFGTLTKMQWQSEKLLFPLQWTQFCVSLSSGSNWTLVVDGQLLGEVENKYSKMPDNLFLFLEVCPQILVLWANFDGCFEVSEGSLMVSHCAIGLRSSVVSFWVRRVYLDHLTSHIAREKV